MLVPSEGVSAADWLVDGLRSFENTAGSIVPPGYEAYARILHPASGRTGPVRWRTIATWSGRTYHPAMQFETIASPAVGRGNSAPPWDGHTPHDLPPGEAQALARTLRPLTTTPDAVWYLVWEGYGGLPKTTPARVESLHRRYLLYGGTIDDACGLQARLRPDGMWTSTRASRPAAARPDSDGPILHRFPFAYWFPADRAWCVATDVDLFWTYVGGSAACVDAVLRDPALEAVPADLCHGLTVDSDAVNRLSQAQRAKWGLS